MDFSSLTSFVSVILAVSLASERLLTMVKAAFPWLAQEQKTDAKEVDLTRDRSRRLVLLAMAWVASWVAASFLVQGDWTVGSLFAQVAVSGAKDLGIPVPLVGLLASSGSAFWNNVLGITKEAKDTRRVETASAALAFNAQAKAEGKQAFDSGTVANAGSRISAARRVDASGVSKASAEVARIVSQGQPSLSGGRPALAGGGQ
jgi:hypothetical protein